MMKTHVSIKKKKKTNPHTISLVLPATRFRTSFRAGHSHPLCAPDM